MQCLQLFFFFGCTDTTVHFGDVQLIVGGRRPQTSVRVEPRQNANCSIA